MAEGDKTTQKTSQSTTQTTKTGKPATFGGGNLSSGNMLNMILSGAQQQNQAIGQGAGVIAEQMARMEALMQGASQEQIDAVQMAAENAAEKANIDYQVATKVQEMQKLFGLNPDDVNNEIATSLSQADAARKARTSVRAEFDQLASADLLTNPIGYIMAQLKMPAVAAKNNALADQEDLALQNIQNRTALLANVKSTVTANTADQMRSLQLREAEAAAKAANAQLKQKEIENASKLASNQMQLIQVANMAGDNMRQALTSVIQLRDYQESSELRRMQREQILESKRMIDEEKAVLNARLKIVSDALGKDIPMTADRLKNMTNKKVQEKWLNVAQSGVFGEKMQESLEFYRGEGNPQKLPQSVVRTVQKLDGTASAYRSTAERAHLARNPTGKKLSSEEATALGYEMYANELEASANSRQETRDLSHSYWEKTYNPYVAQFTGFNSAINQLPELKGLGNNIVKSYVDAQLKSGITAENLTVDQQQQVLGAIIEDVRSRKLTPKDAASQISDYFRTAASYNLQLNHYNLFNLPPQEKYLFTVGGSIRAADNPQKVDLMDPKEVENMLIRKATIRSIPMTQLINPFAFPIYMEKTRKALQDVQEGKSPFNEPKPESKPAEKKE